MASYNMHITTAKAISALETPACPSGIWIHILGDSRLRGVCVHVSARSCDNIGHQKSGRGFSWLFEACLKGTVTNQEFQYDPYFDVLGHWALRIRSTSVQCFSTHNAASADFAFDLPGNFTILNRLPNFGSYARLLNNLFNSLFQKLFTSVLNDSFEHV